MKHLIKKILLSAFVLATVVSCSKKDNPPDTNNGKQADVYTAGFVEVSTGPTTMHKATIWKNGVAQQLSNTESLANKVLVAGNDVYAAGREFEGAKSVAKLWKNGIANTPFSSSNNTEATTFSVAANGDIFIVLREWNNSGSAYKILKNGIPISLTPPTNYSIEQLLDVFVAGNDVYVAGVVKEIGFNKTKAAFWKNGIPDFLQEIFNPSDNLPPNTAASQIFVSGNDVYVLGTQSRLSEDDIVLWKNGTPVKISENSQTSASCLFVSGSDVYITGTEFDQTTFKLVSRLWKNGSPVFSTSENSQHLTSVFVLNNNVYLAGHGYINNTMAYLWVNGVLETPAIEKASVNSVFVVEK